MKVLFCGFGKLGRTCLEKLVEEGYTISFILTHKELESNSVDTYALNNHIPFSYQDSRKVEASFFQQTFFIDVTFLISVNYRYILPKPLLEITEYAINIHGSLLPKYRGRTPHVWSIINGEEYSGVTSHIIEESVDTGDIIVQVPVKIDEEDTGYSLLEKFEGLYPGILVESLNRLNNQVELIKQNECEASYFGKRTPDMGYIDFNKTSEEVLNFVRAQSPPYPGAYYYLKDGRRIYIYKMTVERDRDMPELNVGVIHNGENGLYVKCKNDLLKVHSYKID